MSKALYFFLLSFLLLSPSILAVNYKIVNTVPDSPGGRRFNNEAGVPFTLKTMRTINSFIWQTFKQPSHTQRKRVRTLTLNITNLNDGALGETGGDNIYINSSGINDFPPGGDAFKFEFTSLMYHEMTHIFQWSGRGTAPGGLTEGVADYVMIKSGYYHPESYTKPGEGKRWDEGYGVTARFLEYCDSLRDGFTAELNNMMRGVYKDKYFRVLLEKPLVQVWRDYKHKYGYNVSGTSGGGVLNEGVKY
ncbi:basic secretory protease [Phtheirospermum japonicum]|uniref:Basic secretory protease n=1 Tax=Phtheirospermum japonicum TaxID=374723 RepID=A0A830BKK0_9LAMI|nr:basic secretory protease [Phtheirospermum japonicum]